MKYTPPIGGAPTDPYVDGNPGTGTEGSAVPAAAIEDPQREIDHVITTAGLMPDHGDTTQLAQAMALIAAANSALLPRGTTIASAGTTNIGAATSDYIEISGTTTITSLGTGTTWDHVWVKFQSALKLTHNATSLILPTGANIQTAAGDIAEFVRISGGNWQCLEYQRADGKALTTELSPLGTTIAAAATTNIGAADSNYVEISGSGFTITSFGAGTARNHMWLKFTGTGSITHNGTSLISPTGANITVAAGDRFLVQRRSGSNWEILQHVKKSANAAAEFLNGQNQYVAGNLVTGIVAGASGKMVIGSLMIIWGRTPANNAQGGVVQTFHTAFSGVPYAVFLTPAGNSAPTYQGQTNPTTWTATDFTVYQSFAAACQYLAIGPA